MARESPARFHVLAKPSGATCNLACDYCFFLEKEKLYPGSRFRMTDSVLETYIRQLIDGHRTDEVTVAWQGGEPTLMGLEFYRRAIALQEKYRRPGMTFENTMQINGTLLTDEWCAFFKQNDYLIGLSLDGPRAMHDAHRVDKGGRPTFDKVMRGLRLLQKHGVEYNVLATVNSANAAHPLEVYRFLRDEAKTSWMQFIPVVQRDNLEQSVTAERFGKFLIAIFDEWVRRDVGSVFVQTFEASARSWLGMPSSMCVFDETCGNGVALEHNGDVYSCDHFVEPKYLLGNIARNAMGDLLGSRFQQAFGAAKRDTLPQLCRDCDVRFACHGECPKNRFISTPAGEPGLNYLCEGYKAFFHHIDRPMRIIANLLRHGQPADYVMGILPPLNGSPRLS